MIKRLLLTFLLCGIVSNAKSASLSQTFDVEIGFFDAAKVNMSYTLNNSDYTFSAHMSTSGLFDTFYSFDAHYKTIGIIRPSHYITTDYTQKTKSASHLRTKQLIFDDNGVLIRRTSSKDEVKKTVDIDLPSFKVDAHDIQTVLIMLIKNFQTQNSCNLNKTVFNGKKTYHITLKDEGRVLYQNKKVKVSGTAHKCSAFIHQDNAQKGDLLWQTTAEKPILFYVMRDEKTGLIFVPEIEIASTPLGDLDAYMTDLTIED